MSEELLPVGTRIRFNATLGEDATSEHPAYRFATDGELGEIVGHGCWEGYWVKADSWPAKFGACRSEFEPVEEV